MTPYQFGIKIAADLGIQPVPKVIPDIPKAPTAAPKAGTGIPAAAKARLGVPKNYEGQHGPWARWQDEAVSGGHYRPGLSNGKYVVDIGHPDSAATLSIQPQDFKTTYGELPADYAEQWLKLKQQQAQPVK